MAELKYWEEIWMRFTVAWSLCQNNFHYYGHGINKYTLKPITIDMKSKWSKSHMLFYLCWVVLLHVGSLDVVFIMLGLITLDWTLHGLSCECALDCSEIMALWFFSLWFICTMSIVMYSKTHTNTAPLRPFLSASFKPSSSFCLYCDPNHCFLLVGGIFSITNNVCMGCLYHIHICSGRSDRTTF